MIIVITTENRDQYTSLLDQMYRQRKQVFVDRLGWDLAVDTEGREIDRFDTDETTYLIASPDGTTVDGSMRLNPTTAPHLMSDIFDHMCVGGAPRGSDIWESSRTCIALARDRLNVMNETVSELYCGMIEYAILCGIRKITFVASADLQKSVVAWGLNASLNINPLGLPEIDGQDINCAFALQINAEGLWGLRQMRGLNRPALQLSGGYAA